MSHERTTGISVVIGIYLVGVGLLTGFLIGEIRFDHRRSDVLGRYEQALHEWQSLRIERERAQVRTP